MSVDQICINPIMLDLKDVSNKRVTMIENLHDVYPGVLREPATQKIH